MLVKSQTTLDMTHNYHNEQCLPDRCSSEPMMTVNRSSLYTDLGQLWLSVIDVSVRQHGLDKHKVSSTCSIVSKL